MAWRTAEDARRKKKQGEEEEQEQETRQIYKPGVERQKRQAAAEAVNASRREQAAKLGVGYLPGDVRVPGSPTQQADGFTGDFRHDAMLADRRAQQQSAWDVAGVTQRVSQTINNGLGMMGLGQAPNSERDYMEMRRFYQLMEDAGRDSGNTDLIDKARQGYGNYTARLDDIERQRGGTLAGAGNIDKAGAYFRMFRNAMDTGDLERAEYARSMINSVASSYDGKLQTDLFMMPKDWKSKTSQEKADYWQQKVNEGNEAYVIGMMTENQDLIDRAKAYTEWASGKQDNAYAHHIGDTQGAAAEYSYRYNGDELRAKQAEAEATIADMKKAMEEADKKYENYVLGVYKPENPSEDPEAAYYQAKQSYENAQAELEIWKSAINLEKGDEFARLEERIPKAAAKTNRTPEGSAVRGQILKGQAAFRRHEQEAIDKVYPNGFKNALLSEEESAAQLEEIRNGYAETPTMTNNTYQLRQAGYSFAMKKSDMGFGMTDEQKETFFYIYAEDPQKAEEFAEACKKKNEDAYYAEMSEAETNPAARLWKEFKGANLKLIGGAMPFSVVGQKMSKEGTALAQSVGAGREKYGVMNTGFLSGKLDENIPFVGGKSLNDWTQLKSSMIMSGETAAAAKVAMATGHPEAAAIIEIAGLYMQSGAAANDDYIEMKRNGWSDNAALTHALFAGVAEATFEKVSLESLVNQDISRGFVRNLLTQGGIEASEEVATTIANHITDAAIARVNGYDNDRERRAKEYMGQGMSYNEAYNKADVDIMADLLDDALGGFLSGGLMSGGDYAVHGARTSVGKVTTGIRNTRSIYTGENLLGMGENVELHRGAAESVVNQVQNDSTGETTKAMQAYAEANKISVKSKESTRAVRANVEAVTDAISDKMYSNAENVDGRMAGAVAVYEETVKEYGDGIKPVAQAALRNTVNKIVTEAGSRGNVSATTAFQEQVGKIENPEARDVAQDALDYAVYRKTTNATQRSEVMEGFRHLDESSAISEMRAQRNKARGDMTMQATVTDENGQSKAVDITGITEDGKAVELSDGVKIDVNDLQADADTKDAIQMIASMELGANANKVMQAYRDSGLSGTEGYRFIADYTQAIEQGRTNRVSLERATKASSLDAKTVMEAYTIGQQIAHAETRKAMDRLKNAPKKKGATGRTATIDTSAIEGVTMSQSEREQFELANRIFSALGVDLRWVASSERNGRYVGANGSYLNGAVTLDIHAGRNFLNDIRSGILATTGHELTHFLEQYAPEQYKALKEFVFQQIVQNGKYGEETLERLIQEKKKRARNKISQREAENEVVADACQNMLLDSKAVSRFAQEHEDAAKGIVRWLDKWFGKLKSAFTGSRLSEEARMMNNLEKDVKQAFGDLWDKALEEAVRMHDEVGYMESEREGQNSDRDTEYLELAKDPKKNEARLQEMVDEAAEQAMPNSKVRDSNGKLLRVYHGTPHGRFTRFVYDYAGKEGGAELGYGHYFTPSKKEAGLYTQGKSDNIYSCNINIENPIIAAEKTTEAFIDELFSRLPMYAKTELEEKYGDIENAKRRQIGKRNDLFLATFADRAGMHPGVFNNLLGNMGYDGVILEDEGYGAEYVVFESAQAKLADPVTRDNTGKIIPLSERFNTFNPDIRYSEREDQGLRDRVSDLEEQLDMAELNGLSQTDIRKLNNELIKARGQLDAYTAKQRRLVKRTSFNEILRNLENYERVDLESLAEQISDSAWDDYDQLSDDDLIDVLRETINERLEDFAPGEADDPKYGLFVKKPKSGGISVLRSQTEKAGVNLNIQSESAAPSDGTQFSERTWTASRFVQDRENAAKALAKALDVTQKQAEKYIDDINSVAKAIADDRARLDYMSSPGRSAFKSNAEYGGSIDFSTLCKKRQMLTGTFNAIQHALANTVLTAEDVLRVRQMMQDAGLEVNCGMCYVEGSRARMGEYNKTFLELYKKYFPDNWQPKMEDVNTTDGLELMRMEHPECYEQYEHFYNNHGTLRSEDKAIFSSQAKPKEYQLRTEYKGEIKDKFQNETNVDAKNRNGGMRMQSFSDFEIVHLIDCMQVIMDMSEVGLAGQAYTKVPEFAEALGRTGLKINLSLVAKGVDENGKLIFNDVEGMPHDRAFGIREKYSENVGTILVVYDDAQLVAAMADDKVDFIIPFHRSQWRKSQYAAMGLPKTTKDYTYQQNEKWLNPKEHTHKYRDKIVPTKCTNYMPNEYWDFSLSGTENARRYLEMCAKDGKRPKFYKLLKNNGDGSFSLKTDGSTDGYWKLLIDFKMYDNNGVGVPQQPVQPIFDMENAMQMLDDYSGDPSRFPVAEGIVDEFVSQYKAEHPGRQYSMRDYDLPSDAELLDEVESKNLTDTEQKRLLGEYQTLRRQIKGMEKRLSTLEENRAKLEEKIKSGKEYADSYVQMKDKEIENLRREIEASVEYLNQKMLTPKLADLLKSQRRNAEKKAVQHKEQVFQNYKDRKNRTSIRNRIKNLHAEMSRDLLRPREGHFVPEKLIRPVVDLLDLVNTETNREKSESAQARIDAINAAYDAIRKDERYSQYYDETVKDMLVELSGTLEGRSIYDLTTAELEDVYTVMKAMRTTIRNAIKADLIEKGKEIWEIGNEMRQELRAGRGAHALQLLEKYHMTMLSAKRAFNRFGGYQQSSAWNKVYRMLDDAQLKMLTLEMQGTRIFDRVLEGKENLEKAEKLTSYREDDLVDVGLKDETGKAVPIPRGMMLSLYMHLQNEENMRHLMYGGITLPDFKRYYKGRSEAWGQGTVSVPALGARVAALDELLSKGELSDAEYEEAYKEHKAEIDEIFDSIRTAIEEQLTDYDRQWIAASREFFDGFSRRELNRVTNEMYGFSKARVDNYFPIVTDSDFLKSEFDSISKNISLENAGFMKERVRASNPIHLEDITKAVNRQISNVSRYAGLTQALKTFGNVYNVQDRGFTDSVKKAMAKTYGKNGQQYVENLITDMVGGRNTPGTIFDRVKGNYAQAVLAANLSVTIKQAASFPTAAATVGWGPLMKALARGGKSNLPISRADSNLISIYSPLLWYRSKGAIDVEIGDIANGRDWTQKAKWLMGWIEKTDIATVGRLWYAAEYYVKDNYNLEKGTEEQIKNGESPFYRKVAEVFADIVEDTQPNYTILQRPDILRNPNKLVRAMVMFSTQRFQNGNILIDAIGEYRAMVRADKQNGTPQTKAARKAARQKLTRAISSQTVSAMVLSAMTLLAGAVMHRMNPWRDDDDELTFESIAEEYLNGFLSSLTGSFLAGSEVYEGLQAMLTGSKYYGNDVGGISTINELATAVIQFEQQAVKLIGDEDSTAKDWQNLAEKQLWKVGEYLSQMTGIPTANIKKIIEGGRNHIADIMNEEFFSFEAGVDRSTAVNARRYYKAWMAGDNAKVRDVLKEMRDSGKSEDAIRNAISKQAKTAYEEGNIDIDQYAELLDRTGFWDEEKLNGKILDIVRDEYVAGTRTEKETVDLLIRYNAKVENEDDAWKILQRWETTAEHKGEEDYHYSEYEDLIKDLDAGKTFDEAAAEYLDHGYEEKNLRSNAVSHTKELYQAGKLTDDEAIDQILDYAWKKEDGAYRKLTENEAWMKLKEWRESAGHEEEEDYHYTQYDAIDEAITAGQDIKGLVKELTDHGVKADNVTSHIKGYLIDQYIAGNSTEAKLKNQLSKYLGLTGGEDRDEIVRDANCKKLTGYDYDNLGKGYKAGKIPSQTATKALTQYGGMSSSDAKARVRYWDFQKSYPDSNLGQTTLDKYYDSTIENVGRTLQGSGIGLDAYVRYAEAASKAKGTDKDGDGKTDSGSKKAAIMQIIDGLSLTPQQKDALYYFNGWAASKIREAPWH